MEVSSTPIEATLGYIIDREKKEVLLATKTRVIGIGYLNGYGGKREVGETIEECLIREVKTECGLDILEETIVKVAEIVFHNQKDDGEFSSWLVHIFICEKKEGIPVSSEEMQYPGWYDMSFLPVQRLMLADSIWLPSVLSGKKIKGEVWYGPKQKTFTRMPELRQVESF